jgi:hypothetical protein
MPNLNWRFALDWIVDNLLAPASLGLAPLVGNLLTPASPDLAPLVGNLLAAASLVKRVYHYLPTYRPTYRLTCDLRPTT